MSLRVFAGSQVNARPGECKGNSGMGARAPHSVPGVNRRAWQSWQAPWVRRANITPSSHARTLRVTSAAAPSGSDSAEALAKAHPAELRPSGPAGTTERSVAVGGSGPPPLGDGKPAVIYVRDKRHPNRPELGATPS